MVVSTDTLPPVDISDGVLTVSNEPSIVGDQNDPTKSPAALDMSVIGPIIGGIGALLVVLAAAVVGFALCRRRRQVRDRQQRDVGVAAADPPQLPADQYGTIGNLGTATHYMSTATAVNNLSGGGYGTLRADEI